MTHAHNEAPWKGLRIVLTGATGGIGRVLAKKLAEGGAVLFLQGRSPRLLDELADALRQSGGKAEPLVCDLSSLAEVSTLARGLNGVDVVIHNAGVGFGVDRTKRELSRDGYELRLAVNYLAPFVLNNVLLARGNPARAIVNVASAGQAPLDLDDLQMERAYDGTLAYRRSKLALVMHTFDVAAETKVPCNALHPGTFLDTGMVREAGITPQGTAEEGADSVLHVLTASLTGTTGMYYDRQSKAQPDAQANDAAFRRALAVRTRELVARFLSTSGSYRSL